MRISKRDICTRVDELTERASVGIADNRRFRLREYAQAMLEDPLRHLDQDLPNGGKLLTARELFFVLVAAADFVYRSRIMGVKDE